MIRRMLLEMSRNMYSQIKEIEEKKQKSIEDEKLEVLAKPIVEPPKL
jgi:hypothetical protein